MNIAADFFNSGRGYVEIKDTSAFLLPRRLNRVYNVDPNKMEEKEVETLFGEVLRGLSY